MPEIYGASTDESAWFRENEGRYLYQTGIDLKKGHYSGLMLIKPENSTGHRIFFMTEMGIKIFDMELFRQGGYKMHYCIEELNRRFLVNTLVEDINLMLYNTSGIAKIKVMQEKNNGRIVIRKKDRHGTSYCFVESTTNKVEEVVRYSNLVKKLNIKYDVKDTMKPDSITISHYNIKLNIHLISLDEKRTEIDE